MKMDVVFMKCCRKAGLALILLFPVLILSAFRADAQILVPKDYSGKGKVSIQEAILIFQDGKESLSLEARYEFSSPSAYRQAWNRRGTPASPPPTAGPPAHCVWVVPVLPKAGLLPAPSESLFEDLYDWIHPSIKARYGLRTGRPHGINRFSESVFSAGTGSAENQASWSIIPGTGEAAIGSLLAWIEEENLAGLDINMAREYALKGWTFALGVIKNPQMNGTFGPAHFYFETPEAVFPLRFQNGVGLFNFRFYFLTGMDASVRHLSSMRLSPVTGLRTLSREYQTRGYITLASLETPHSLVSHLSAVRASAIPSLPEDTLRFYALQGSGIGSFSPMRGNQQPRDLAVGEKKAATSPVPGTQGISPSQAGRGYRQPAARRRGYY